MKSGWLTTGPKVSIFEKKIKNFIGVKNSIAVSSGTSALHLAYLSKKIGVGDEIIVPSYTFCSTINTIVHTGATPVFCDIDKDTLCANPNDIKKRITKKTKGIVVVHFAGMPADMDKINAIAKKHNLFVVEDAAHAFMTKYKGKNIGQGDNTVCFSFYATKNLTTVEGGMVTTNDDQIANFIKIMSMHGISKDAWKRYSKEGNWRYDVIAPGYKYNMTDIQAAIGLEQLKHLTMMLNKRKKIAKWYNQYLSVNKNIILPKDTPYKNSQHGWHLYTIQLKKNSSVSRDQLIEKLKENGIYTSVHFIPNHLQSYYKNTTNKPIVLPVTEKVFSSILSLPFFVTLSENEVKHIAKVINQITNEK